MSCCPEITTTNDLPSVSEVSYELPLTNLVDTGGVLTRSGGNPSNFDAFADTDTWVDGTSCALWEWIISIPNESNELLYLVHAEDGSYSFGWYFTNFLANYRRARYDNGILDFPIFYRNSTLGFNYFAASYNNGTIQLFETDEFAPTAPGWIVPASYARTGLNTATRWRLRVYVKPVAADAQSSVVSWGLGATGDICAIGTWTLAPITWAATATVTTSVQGVQTKRFDAGLGSAYYVIPPVIDSGNELRSKTVKAMRTTGRRTNVSMKAYGYDLNEEINTDDLEAGTNASTRAQTVSDTTQVAESERKQINVKNAVLATVRLEGDDTGKTERDEVHEIVVEQAEQGVRR